MKEWVRDIVTGKKHVWVRHVILLVVLLAVVVPGVSHFVSPYQASQTSYSSAGSDGATYRATVSRAGDKTLEAIVWEGPYKGQTITVDSSSYAANIDIREGSTIMVYESDLTSPILVGPWRIPALMMLVAVFVIIVVYIGKRKGATSFAGLLASIFVLVYGVIPMIKNGVDAFTAIVLGSMVIAAVSVFVAHGFRRRTALSVFTIIVILLFVSISSLLLIQFLSLSGAAEETGATLRAFNDHINLAGILAGSIVIATLGVLDDVVTTQVAAIDHLHQVDSRLTVHQLYTRGMDIGREHIAALINTLALVYVGAAFPTIIIYVAYSSNVLVVNFWNSEFIVQEVARTIITSIGLIVAVPASTYIAASLYHRWARNDILKTQSKSKKPEGLSDDKKSNRVRSR